MRSWLPVVRSVLFFRSPRNLADMQLPVQLSVELIDSEGKFPWAECVNDRFFAEYRQRLDLKHSAIIARWDGKLALTAWIAHISLEIGELAHRWTLPDCNSCVYDVVTFPEYRRRGIYTGTLQWCIRRLRRENDRCIVWIYCEKANRASRMGILKAGFEFRGTAHSLCWMRREVLRLGSVERITA